MLGFPVMDPMAGTVICLFILKVSYDILKDAIVKMLDTACGEDYEKGCQAQWPSRELPAAAKRRIQGAHARRGGLLSVVISIAYNGFFWQSLCRPHCAA